MRSDNDVPPPNGGGGSKVLKVGYKYRPVKGRFKVVPALVLSGEWLRKLNFDVSDKVLLEYQTHKIVITIILPENPTK